MKKAPKMIPDLSLHFKKVELVRIKDGDTIVVDIDLDFAIWTRRQVLRLRRINADEAGTPTGDAAKEALAKYLIIGEIIVQTFKTPDGWDERKEKYGRWLAEVWVGGVNINDLMVTSGHAKYVDY